MNSMIALTFYVREPGKTGGRWFTTLLEARLSRRSWLDDTGIKCEMWYCGENHCSRFL